MKKFFQALMCMVMFIFYPVISFRWVRYARRESAQGYGWKFAATGVAGIIGCAMYVWMCYTPIPWKFVLALIATIFYGGGNLMLFRMIRIILEK